MLKQATYTDALAALVVVCATVAASSVVSHVVNGNELQTIYVAVLSYIFTSKIPANTGGTNG